MVLGPDPGDVFSDAKVEVISAFGWLKGEGSNADTAALPDPIEICLPDASEVPEGDYKFDLKVHGLGTLDPHVVVEN